MNDRADRSARDDRQADWVLRLAAFLHRVSDAQAIEWDAEHTEISIATMGCVDEATLRQYLRQTLSAAEGDVAEPDLSGLTVTALEATTRIEKDHGCEAVTRLWTWRRLPWPSAEEAAGLPSGSEEQEDWRHLAALAGTCGLLGIGGYAVQLSGVGPGWLAPSLYVAGMVAGGWDAAKDAIPGIFRGRIDIHFLMLAVALGASLIGAFGEGALLLFLFSTAGALEHFALHRTRRAIDALFRVAPKTAVVIDGQGEESLIPVEEVSTGMRLAIRPGDTVPVDATVLEGESALDEASLTGEANPVPKRQGDEVFSGTQNLWGALEVRCLRPASGSALQKIIELIQRARDNKAPSQRFTDKFGPGYTIAVLGATAAMFFIWWLAMGIDPFLNVDRDGGTTYSAFYRAMTLLVVASPCALVLSIPSAVLAAIAWGARRGILFRGGAAIEQLAGVQVVALDKTGTLTTGDLQVIRVESFPPGRDVEVLELAYTLEQKANHPIARAIVRHGRAQNIQPRRIEGFRSLTGKGVSGEIDQQSCLLGRRELLLAGPLADWVKTLPDEQEGVVEIWFLQDDLLGRILLRDTVRPESAGVLANLRRAGLETVMLTGDRLAAAEAVGGKLGLSEIRAGLSPEDKVEAIHSLSRGGRRVAMVGDGINDAPCLAAADVAVAMGARGSDAALEQSDIVLMNDKIENFFAAHQLSKRARRIIRQNIAVSLGTIVVMVAAAVLGIVPITIGVLAHEGSTVLVCLNSMRLLR